MSNEGGRNPITFEHHVARVVVVGRWCCWRLPTALSRGYTTIQFGLAKRQGHVAFYERLVGPVPTGLTLDHLCRNRWCVHPNHVTPLTLGENVLRGDSVVARNARKKTCPRGHLYDRLTKGGKYRRCGRCHAASNRRAYRKRKEKS